MKEENYPGILSRIMAIMTDSVIIIILMFLVSYFFSYFNNVPTILRIFAFVFFFLFTIHFLQALLEEQLDT
jgi:hypothetical protein